MMKKMEKVKHHPLVVKQAVVLQVLDEQEVGALHFNLINQMMIMEEEGIVKLMMTLMMVEKKMMAVGALRHQRRNLERHLLALNEALNYQLGRENNTNSPAQPEEVWEMQLHQIDRHWESKEEEEEEEEEDNLLILHPQFQQVVMLVGPQSNS
jgi:hypothetical protein